MGIEQLNLGPDPHTILRRGLKDWHLPLLTLMAPSVMTPPLAHTAPKSGSADGRLAQRKSTAFTLQGSLVQSQYRPPISRRFRPSTAQGRTSLPLKPPDNSCGASSNAGFAWEEPAATAIENELGCRQRRRRSRIIFCKTPYSPDRIERKTAR